MTRHIDYRNTLYEHCKRDGPSHHSRSNVKQIQRGENLINTTLKNWSAVTHPITLVHCSPGPPSTTGDDTNLRGILTCVKRDLTGKEGSKSQIVEVGELEYGERVLEGTSVL